MQFIESIILYLYLYLDYDYDYDSDCIATHTAVLKVKDDPLTKSKAKILLFLSYLT